MPDPAGTPALTPAGSQAFAAVPANTYVNGPPVNVKGYRSLTLVVYSTSGVATAAGDVSCGVNPGKFDGTVLAGPSVPPTRTGGAALTAGNAAQVLQYDLAGLELVRPFAHNANATTALDITLEWYLS